MLLVLCLLLSACGAPAAQPSPAAAGSPPPIPSPGAEPPYDTLDVYIDGLLAAEGSMKDGKAYLEPESICSYLGIDCAASGDSSSFVLSLDGIEFSGSSDEEQLFCNGRYFYAPEGWFSDEGRLYLPCDLLCRFLCLNYSLDSSRSRVDISSLGAHVIEGGKDYYELNYPSDQLFWLSQIIYAEAFQQPMEGLIGVGNVVLNRVKSPDFPATVFDVIFQIDHNIVQFEPISNGSVYSQTDRRSYIAACLVLDGYSTVGDSLYFVNPKAGSGWFDRELELTAVIGDHNFYSPRGEDDA